MLNLLFNNPALFIVVLLAIIVALSVHEFAHALIGYKLGDPTAERLGRLTLNPLAHIDPWGLLLLVSIGFGWGKPVPFNPANLKWPKWGPVAVALAGPASNLILAIISVLAVHLLVGVVGLGEGNALVVFFLFSVIINLILMLFNLIPLPPLDGSKLLLRFLDKPQYANFRYMLETRGSWALIGVILIDAVLNLGLFASLFSWVYDLSVWLLGGIGV